MFRLDKRKIFLLYQYYLLGGVNFSDALLLDLGEEKKKQERIAWFTSCLEKEKFLSERIGKKLKTGWEFSYLPPLERAVLVYAACELLSEKNGSLEKMIIDQTINFSKVYLEKQKYKYINKILDLLVQESKGAKK